MTLSCCDRSGRRPASRRLQCGRGRLATRAITRESVRAKAEKIETLRYYDVVVFTRLLKVPGCYLCGFNDTTVPPTSMCAAYNEITSPKDVIVDPPAGHGRTREQLGQSHAWLLERLGKQCLQMWAEG